MKNTFAIITIDEIVTKEDRETGVFKEKPISVLKIWQFLGIPYKKLYAREELITK